MKVAGVDEAGRGPVLGPMVIPSASFEETDLEELKKIGVKDSKRLTKRKRESLYPQIIHICSSYSLVEIGAEEINKRMKTCSLNDIEAWGFSKAIMSLTKPPEVVFCDCCERHEWVFQQKIERWMGGPNGTSIESRHRADENFPAASAASILAKVRRDELILEVAEELGCDIGSGYTGDAKTRVFLKTYYKEHKVFPNHTRLEWKTVKRLEGGR